METKINKISSPADDYQNNRILSPEPGTISIDAAGRQTALWALSEAALGGVLHVFKIPFTGLFIGSSAVFLITLTAFFCPKKGEILKAAVIVLVVKAAVSPYTPVNSYAAVFLQGILGELFFGVFKNKSIAALLLGISSLLLSAFQKLLVITVVFGMNIWKSIDLFGNYIISQFIFVDGPAASLQISLSLIVLYIIIHLAAGIFAGLAAPKLGRQIIKEISRSSKIKDIELSRDQGSEEKRKRRRFAKKISSYLIFAAAFSIMVLSYIFPVFEKSQGAAAMIMVLRSIIIMLLWYFAAGPYLLKQVRKFLARKEHRYSAEVEQILALLPILRMIVKISWAESRGPNKTRRLKRFTLRLFVRMLTVEQL